MTRIELKKYFIDSFGEKDYKIVSHASLLPNKEIDRDEFKLTYRASLGTNFIMHQLRQGYSPFATIQPVFRYHDYKRVGDGRHLALFEMGGAAAKLTTENKEKIYLDGLEFLLSVGIEKKSLWATYFEGGEVTSKLLVSHEFPADSDSLNIFKKFGIPDHKIVGCNADVAFVGLTREDPCGGPRAHVYFDRGEQFSCSRQCYPEHDENCNRFIEIAVFISEYLEKRQIQSKPELFEFITMNPSNIPFIVIGIGMERVEWMLHKLDDIYSVASLSHLIEYSIRLSTKSSVSRIDALKLVECLIAIVFLNSYGATPGNSSNRRRQFRELLFDLYRLSKKIFWESDRLLSLIDKIVNEYCDYTILREMSLSTHKLLSSENSLKSLKYS